MWPMCYRLQKYVRWFIPIWNISRAAGAWCCSLLFAREMCSLICVMNAASSLTTIPLRAACNSAAQCIFYSGYNLSKPKPSKIQTLTIPQYLGHLRREILIFSQKSLRTICTYHLVPFKLPKNVQRCPFQGLLVFEHFFQKISNFAKYVLTPTF